MRGWLAAAAAVMMLGILTPWHLKLKKGPNRALSAVVKGTCTLVAAGLCLAGCLREGGLADWWLLAGLCLCLAGDVLIIYHFLGGMGAFLLGHLAYIAAFLCRAPFFAGSVPVFIGVFGLIVLLFWRAIPTLGKSWPAYAVYAAVLSAMWSVATMLPAAPGKWTWMTASGAVLFTASDLLLARNMLKKTGPFADWLSLTCYYTGQLLLALSVFL